MPQISPWRKCSTNLQNWWANKMRSSMWIRFIGKNIHGNICHWLVTKLLTIFNTQKSTSLLRFCVCLGRVHQHPQSNEAWKKRTGWIITSQSYRDYDGISGVPTEFEWNIFPGFTMLQLCGKVHRSTEQIRRNTRNFHMNSYYVNVQRHFLWQERQSRRMFGNCKSLLHSCREVWYRTGHLLVQVPRRSGLLWKRIVHKELEIISRKRCCWNSLRAAVQFSV